MDRRSGHIRALSRKMMEVFHLKEVKKCPCSFKKHTVSSWLSIREGITSLTSILFCHDQVKTPSNHDNGPEYNCLLLVHKHIFMGSFRCTWEIHCHQLCLKISTSGAKSCSEAQSETNLLMAQHILAAFQKNQERFLVIVAMWYHQTEKDQRNSPFTKWNQLQI